MTLAKDHVVYTFKGGADGVGPYGSLLFKNSEFYGTTFGGGTGNSGYGCGTVFKVSASGTKSTLYEFQCGTDGAEPEAGLTAGKGGVLYGDTLYGGGASLCSGGCGAVFELMPSGSGYSERVVYAFQGGTDGANPIGNLLIDKSGTLYGTTDHGGGASACPGTSSAPAGCGTVFKLTPAGSGFTETVLYAFQGGNDGALPSDALIDVKGALYGTTQYGGGSTACSSPSSPAGCGTVFKLTPSESNYTEKILYSFKGGTKDGSRPRSALLASKNNMLYGVTVNGGAAASSCTLNGIAGCGTVFEIRTSGKESVIHYFGVSAGDGQLPFDENGLHADSNGALYGTTELGGGAKCACGTVFSLTPSGSSYTEAILYSFTTQKDGTEPRSSLVADAAGTLYGADWLGGLKQSYGIVFSVAP